MASTQGLMTSTQGGKSTPDPTPQPGHADGGLLHCRLGQQPFSLDGHAAPTHCSTAAEPKVGAERMSEPVELLGAWPKPAPPYVAPTAQMQAGEEVECCTITQERDLRMQRFRAYMKESGLDCAIVQDMQDVYWLTGFNTPGAPRGQCLVVSMASATVCTRRLETSNALCLPGLSTAGYTEGHCPVQHIIDVAAAMNPRPRTVAVQVSNERTTPLDARRLYRGLRARGFELRDLGPVLRAMRSPKSPRELALMRRAGEHCSLSMKAALAAAAVEGATEASVAAAAEHAARRDGGDYKAYPAFVAAGCNGERGHYSASDAYTSVREGENLFLELGGCHQRYHAACMRTAYCGEAVPAAMQEAERLVVKALGVMRAALVPGACPTAVHEAAACVLRPLGASGWLIGQRSGYSIGIGFATDWGEADEIITRAVADGSEGPLPLHATLHLIPWVRHALYGAVGISDTVVVQPGGAESLLPPDRPAEEIVLLPVHRPCLTAAKRTRAFFGEMIPAPTPLHRFKKGLGLPYEVLIKDEGQRLGQRAFKALGGGYALSCALLRLQGRDAAQAIADGLTFEGIKRRPDEPVFTFVTASDGNHGAGLAWAAKELGHDAVVYFPRGVARSRVQAATKHGAEVRVSEEGYDATVALAARVAEEEGWTLVQDTAWEGYSAVPADIMDAYKLIAFEAIEEQGARPTHVILQVGVGSFAAAITQFLREHPSTRDARIITVEAEGSACLQASMRRGVKTATEGGEGLPTISAGLDCGVLSDLAWPTLRTEVDATIAFADAVAADGVRALHRVGVTSGESGAATGVGVLRALLADEHLCTELGLIRGARVLAFNTESTTAPDVTAAILRNADDTAPASAGAVTVLGCAHQNQRTLRHARGVYNSRRAPAAQPSL